MNREPLTEKQRAALKELAHTVNRVAHHFGLDQLAARARLLIVDLDCDDVFRRMGWK